MDNRERGHRRASRLCFKSLHQIELGTQAKQNGWQLHRHVQHRGGTKGQCALSQKQGKKRVRPLWYIGTQVGLLGFTLAAVLAQSMHSEIVGDLGRAATWN